MDSVSFDGYRELCKGIEFTLLSCTLYTRCETISSNVEVILKNTFSNWLFLASCSFLLSFLFCITNVTTTAAKANNEKQAFMSPALSPNVPMCVSKAQCTPNSERWLYNNGVTYRINANAANPVIMTPSKIEIKYFIMRN